MSRFFYFVSVHTQRSYICVFASNNRSSFSSNQSLSLCIDNQDEPSNLEYISFCVLLCCYRKQLRLCLHRCLLQGEAKLPFLFSFLFSLLSGNDNFLLEKREERKEKSEENKKKRQSSAENCRFFLELVTGLEPATCSLRMSCTTNCATQALNGRNSYRYYFLFMPESFLLCTV